MSARAARGGFEIRFVAVGKLRPGPEHSLFRHYSERLSWPVSVAEIEPAGDSSASSRRRREGAALIAAIPKDSVAVALDEKGRSMTSREFAGRLAAWRDSGGRTLAAIVGGADGLDQAVRDRAELTLSLGAMTWPHLLVRGLFAEQLYRAQLILAGHPYHRD